MPLSSYRNSKQKQGMVFIPCLILFALLCRKLITLSLLSAFSIMAFILSATFFCISFSPTYNQRSSVRVRLPAPRRRGLCIVRGDFLSPLAHAVAPPFSKRSRSASLLVCKRTPDAPLSLPIFCEYPVILNPEVSRLRGLFIIKMLDLLVSLWYVFCLKKIGRSR